MRTTIRRNKALTYNEQMMNAREDAERSRTHPNGVKNTDRQRWFSFLLRNEEDAKREFSRDVRSTRRFIKKLKLIALGYTRTQRRSFGN
jgi:hypothetical protein